MSIMGIPTSALDAAKLAGQMFLNAITRDDPQAQEFVKGATQAIEVFEAGPPLPTPGMASIAKGLGL